MVTSWWSLLAADLYHPIDMMTDVVPVAGVVQTIAVMAMDMGAFMSYANCRVGHSK